MADPVPAPRLCLAGCGHPEHPITMAGGCPADANGELLLDRLAAEFAEPDDPAPTNGGNLP